MLPTLVSTHEVFSTAHDWSAEVFQESISTIDLNYLVSVFDVFRSNMDWVRFKGLTISLQGQSKDICYAYNEIVTVKEALSEMRSNIDTYHKKL